MTSFAAEPADATRAKANRAQVVEPHAVAGPTSPGRRTASVEALSGLAGRPAGEPAARRDAGPRRGRPSLDALRRQHGGDPTIRRVKILGPSGPLHINDYHFIDRLTLGDAPSSGKHDVIITAFTDFDGLAAQANQHPNEDFDFGGVTWGWKGAHEIFPIADGKTCVKLTTVQIEELTTLAKEGGDVRKAAFATLSAKTPDEGKVIEGFRSVRQQQVRPVQVVLPIATTANKLRALGRVRFVPGSYWTDGLEKGAEAAEAFLMGPNGSKEEGPHLHLFLTCAAKKGGVDEWDHPFTITGYHMTTSIKKHLVLDEEGFAVDKKTLRRPELLKTEPAQVEEMTLLCGLLARAGASADDGGRAEKKVEKKVEEKPWQARDAAVKDKEQHLNTLANVLGVRLKVLQHFVTQIAFLDPQDIKGLATGRSRLREAGFGPEESLLPALDRLAEKVGRTEDDVIGMLDPDSYPTDPEEVVLLYKTLMTTLQT